MQLNLSNAHFRTLVPSWSNLTYFELCCEEPSYIFEGNLPRATLDVLGIFAAECPRLQTLSLELDATYAYSADALEKWPVFRCLENLSLNNSRIRQPNVSDVALLLCRLARESGYRLCSVQLYEEDDDDMEDIPGEKERVAAWKDVQAIFDSVGKLRKLEAGKR